MNRIALSFGLSITAVLIAVNASAQNLSSVNKDKSHRTAASGSLRKLVTAVTAAGADWKVGTNIGPVIGVEPGVPSKVEEVEIQPAPDREMRSCMVILDASADVAAAKPLAVYLAHQTTQDLKRESHYFRASLDGRLEKAVVTHGRIDADGEPVKGSGSKTDEDISSPAVTKSFQAERDYWLKDWLKKQQKAASPAKK